MASAATPLNAHFDPPDAPFVLLVDDHHACLHTMRALVELAGLRCVTANSGAEALVWCDGVEPQAVITDLAMPGLDGHTLADRLKQRYPNLPLILVTGEELDERLVETLRATFSAILRKPFDPQQLIAWLNHLIAPRRPIADA